MERFNQNQALSLWYTVVIYTLKKQIIHAMYPAFLSPIKDQLMGFGQVMDL